MPKGIKNEFKLGMRRLDDPATLRVPAQEPYLHPSAREAFTREASHKQGAEVAEEIRKRTRLEKRGEAHQGQEGQAAAVLLNELRK